jgi:hypothetical protein
MVQSRQQLCDCARSTHRLDIRVRVCSPSACHSATPTHADERSTGEIPTRTHTPDTRHTLLFHPASTTNRNMLPIRVRLISSAILRCIVAPRQPSHLLTTACAARRLVVSAYAHTPFARIHTRAPINIMETQVSRTLHGVCCTRATSSPSVAVCFACMRSSTCDGTRHVRIRWSTLLVSPAV